MQCPVTSRGPRNIATSYFLLLCWIMMGMMEMVLTVMMKYIENFIFRIERIEEFCDQKIRFGGFRQYALQLVLILWIFTLWPDFWPTADLFGEIFQCLRQLKILEQKKLTFFPFNEYAIKWETRRVWSCKGPWYAVAAGSWVYMQIFVQAWQHLQIVLFVREHLLD